jgi:acetylglutamate kinase
MEEIINKARVLVEALPYIKKFYGKTFVIKYGGSAMEDPDIKKTIMEDITLLKYVGVNPVIVHGGGPLISNIMSRLNKDSKFYRGLRITDRETMDIVEMVLVGKINKEIISLINLIGGKAVGISGKDGKLIIAKKMLVEDEKVDLGYVGEVDKINPQIINNLIEGGYITVVSPVGIDIKGETYNINADTVAGEIANALKAEKLILLTDVDGIRSDLDDEKSLVPSLTVNIVNKWIKEEKIVGGMIPKVKACMEAVNGGVKRTHILNGKISHALLLEIFTDQGIGTMILANGGKKNE